MATLKYRNYIFDLYGTLINLRTNEEKAALWRELAKFYTYNGAPYTMKELRAAYLDRVQRSLARIKHTEYPDIEISHMFRDLYRAKGVQAAAPLIRHTTRLFRSLSLDYLHLYDGVAETLDWLKQRGGRLYLLSNGQSEFSLPEMRHLGIYESFDGLHFSADYRICKPDIALMHRLFEAHGIGPEDSVMIGNDHTTDIEIARRIGMDSVYIHTNCSHEITEVDCKYQIWDNDFRQFMQFFDS